MFEINLIRARIIPAGQKRIICGLRYLYFFLWGLSVVVIAFFLIANVQKTKIYEEKLARLERQIALVGSGLMTTEELKMIWSRLLQELKGINYLLNGQILWSAKLDRVCEYLPDGVWIERIHSGGETDGEMPVLREGKRSGVPKKPEQKILVIEGGLLSGSAKGEAEAAEIFIARLKEDALFMDDIDKITLGSTKNREVRSGRRATFRVECVFKKGKGFYE